MVGVACQPVECGVAGGAEIQDSSIHVTGHTLQMEVQEVRRS
jgi:hypothetical protein